MSSSADQPASRKEPSPGRLRTATGTTFVAVLAVAIAAYQQYLQLDEGRPPSATTNPPAASRSADDGSAAQEVTAGRNEQTGASGAAQAGGEATPRSPSPLGDRVANRRDNRQRDATHNDEKSRPRDEAERPDARQSKSSSGRPANSAGDKVGGPPARKSGPSDETDLEEAAGAPQRFVVKNQVIRDLNGNVAYRGDVDLTDTLKRIAAGEQLRFRNDGVVFENREKRLPRQPSGYYREWVHPTAELDGPGPQRIVTGEQGEIYYTHDHYRTFRKLK